MKAALVSLGSTSSQWTADAMRKYFDRVDMIQLKNVEINMGKDGGIFYEGKPFGHYDCVFLKGSFRYANLLQSMGALLEKKVPYMPLKGPSFSTVHNKLLTHLALEQHNIPMPRTYLSPTSEAAKGLLKRVHYPIVMKFPQGTQGKGVMFADSESSASSVLDALGALNQPFIIQEYIETGGKDIRAFVLGEKVVAAMQRKSTTEDKRANLHAGGVGESIQLSREAINLALDTAKALGVDICGVDILEGPFGPLVIEANLSPGLQGLNAVSTLDIPDEIAKFLYRKTKEAVEGKKEVQAKTVMQEISLSNGASQQIITGLTFRGDKIILPPLANRIAGFNDRQEFSIKAKKGHIEIEEFKM